MCFVRTTEFALNKELSFPVIECVCEREKVDEAHRENRMILSCLFRVFGLTWFTSPYCHFPQGGPCSLSFPLSFQGNFFLGHNPRESLVERAKRI